MSDEHLATAAWPAGANKAPGPYDAAALRRRGDAGRALLAVLAYAIAYLVLRLGEHGALERDEAEMVYLAQDLRLGYGTQPPLYTWLQWLAFQVFGVTRFALAIVKDVSLAAIYVAMYRAALPLAGRRAAVAVAASLLLFPQIGWEAVRIQTHSVLMMALACGLLWAYVALLARPGLARYAVFGLVAGLGLLAKYNFGILLAGVVGASLLVREHRALLWRRRARIAVLVMLLVALSVTLPHAAWLVQHPDAAFAGTVHKMQDGTEHAPYLHRVLQGGFGLLSAMAAFVAVPGIVFTLAAWPVRKRLALDAPVPAGRFFLWLYAICCLQLALLVLLGVVGTVKERWLMPVLFSLPLALFVLVPALRRQQASRKIVRIAGVAAFLLLALLPARTWFGPLVGKTVAAHYPYTLLAQALQREYPASSTFIADDVMVAGNVRFAQPALRPLLLDDILNTRRRLAGPVVLLTQEGDDASSLAARFRAAYPTARLAAEQRLALPMRFGAKGTLGFIAQRYAVDAPAGPRAPPHGAHSAAGPP